MDRLNNSVVIKIPSRFGFEKVAAKGAASVAKNMGFCPSQIDDIKTAVTEACLNAVEHGNKFDQNIDVSIKLNPNSDALIIEIMDRGLTTYNFLREPDIDKKINGVERSRGWGLFLIHKLMNEVEIKSIPEKGNIIKMTLYKKSAHILQRSASR